MERKKAHHPMDETMWVEFDEAAHRYEMVSHQEGVEAREWLPSCTQFVGHYIPPFNAVAKAEEIAKRRGTDPKELLKQWDAEKEYACDFGTRTHENQEYMMTNRKPPNMPKDDRERGIMRSGWQAIKTLREEGWQPMFAELMVFSPRFMLAGTVDAIFRKGRERLVADWKTNKEIRRSNPRGETFYPPLDTVPDCEFEKYSLQLNLYKRILFAEGYLDDMAWHNTSLMIIHLTPEAPQYYPIETSSNIAELLLDYKLTGWNMADAPF